MTTKIAQTIVSPWLTPVRLATTANISGTYDNGFQNDGLGSTLTIMSSTLSVDGLDVEVGDRVLLNSQSLGNENGIYIVSSISSFIVLQRSSDQQSLEQYKIGQYVSVGAGNSNAGKIFSVVEPLPNRLGIDDLSWIVPSSGGAIVLPTTANRIAYFTDTAGTISSAPDNVTNAGNIAAGLSGIPGVLTSFPPTAASGSLSLSAANNSGDFPITISNHSANQAVTYTLADPNAATGATILCSLSIAPLTSNQLMSYSGVSGVLVNSGLDVSTVQAAINNSANPQDYRVLASDLASGGQVFVYPAGQIHEYVVRTILSNKAITDFSGGGGDRDIILTDGTTVYTTLSAAFIQASSNAGWGSTNCPYPSVACDTVTVIAAGLYFIYSGGTTDYTDGEIKITLTTQKVF